MASASEVWSQLLSWLSLLLTVVLLTPQAYLNYTRKSTEGLSIPMMWIFLVASIIPASYYVYDTEPVALDLSWFGFAVIGIFVLCQVPYYDPVVSDGAAASGLTEELRLYKRRVRFVWRFVAYTLVSSLCFVLIYFLFVVSGPSSAFSWFPQTVGYILPTVLTVLGYMLQLRLIVAEKDASGISLGFIALDMSACVCTITSIALDRWDGAAAAPLIVIFACQTCMAALRLCIYPPHNKHVKYMKEAQEEPADTAGETDERLSEDEGEEEEEVESQEEGEEWESGDEEVAEIAEERLEGGQVEQSDTEIAHVDQALQHTHKDEDELKRGLKVELASASSVEREGFG